LWYSYITKPSVCIFDVCLHETSHETFGPLVFEIGSLTFRALVTLFYLNLYSTFLKFAYLKMYKITCFRIKK